MALLYKELVEHLDFDEIQETHESEIAILNEVNRLAPYEFPSSEMHKTAHDIFLMVLLNNGRVLVTLKRLRTLYVSLLSG